MCVKRLSYIFFVLAIITFPKQNIAQGSDDQFNVRKGVRRNSVKQIDLTDELASYQTFQSFNNHSDEKEFQPFQEEKRSGGLSFQDVSSSLGNSAPKPLSNTWGGPEKNPIIRKNQEKKRPGMSFSQLSRKIRR